MALNSIQKKSIFLVKSKPESLAGAESWLRSNGWEVHSSDELKDAITQILMLQPKHVVVCMDHENPRVRFLPKLLEQALQTRVMAYLETTAITSLTYTAGMDYVLYPPVAGSTIERMAAKVERDARRAAAMRAGAGAGEPIGPSKFLNSDKIEIKGPREEARHALIQLISGPSMPMEDDAKTAVRDIFAKQSAVDSYTRILYSHTNEGYTENTSIVRGTQRAIEEVALQVPGTEVLPLMDCREAVCFYVNSASHNGFVLCSIAHSVEPLNTFVDLFKTRFGELMSEIDPDFSTSPPVLVSMPQVNFDVWARHQASFSKKFIHLDRECGIAFFEMKEERPPFAPTPSSDMVTLSLLDIDSEKPLLFDVFLHLPLNNKFVLYNRRGYKLPMLQKTRLLSRGVLDVHMRGQEIEQLHRHYLEAYLDQKISEHIQTLGSQVAG